VTSKVAGRAGNISAESCELGTGSTGDLEHDGEERGERERERGLFVGLFVDIGTPHRSRRSSVPSGARQSLRIDLAAAAHAAFTAKPARCGAVIG
jgi:hypothetical protein